MRERRGGDEEAEGGEEGRRGVSADRHPSNLLKPRVVLSLLYAAQGAAADVCAPSKMEGGHMGFVAAVPRPSASCPLLAPRSPLLPPPLPPAAFLPAHAPSAAAPRPSSPALSSLPASQKTHDRL